MPKPGHASHVQTKFFCPISLACFVLQQMDRPVYRCMRDGVLMRYPLHSHQHGTTHTSPSRELSIFLFLSLRGHSKMGFSGD